MRRRFIPFVVALATAAIVGAGAAQAEGNLASNATRLPDLMINSIDLNFSETAFELETGKYYRWRIVHDGAEELAIVAPDLFRNSWINQVIINDLEVTPYGLHSVEFDDEGTIDIWFVPLRPGEYEFWADGYETRGLIGTFVVR
jgi:hypothetical protein